MLGIVFFGGSIVGGVGGALWMRSQMIQLMKHPHLIPEKLLAKLRSDLSLDVGQASKIEGILQRHYESLESLRAESYPKQLDIFKAMDAEVALILKPGQRETWSAMLKSTEQHYLPEKPIAMPSADRVFSRFDSNKDGFLTQSEVPPGVWQKIQEADKDGDNKVSTKEYKDHLPKGFLDGSTGH